MKIDQKRLEEVKAAATRAAPEADLAECAAALLVVTFDPRIREHVKSTQPRLWAQIVHALGPIAPPEERKPEAKPADTAGGI